MISLDDNKKLLKRDITNKYPSIRTLTVFILFIPSNIRTSSFYHKYGIKRTSQKNIARSNGGCKCVFTRVNRQTTAGSRLLFPCQKRGR